MTTTKALTIKTLDDILFEDRERGFGAYVLRKDYSLYLGAAVLLIFGVLIAGVTLSQYFQKQHKNIKEKEIVIHARDIDFHKNKNASPKAKLPPAPPKTEAPAPAKQLESKALLPPKPTPQEQLQKPDASLHEMAELEKSPISERDTEGEKTSNPNAFVRESADKNGQGAGSAPPATIREPEPVKPVEAKPQLTERKEDPRPEDFVIAQKRPEPVNMKDIQAQIVYPPLLREIEVEGDVTLKILVDENGYYKKHIVLKQVHPLLLQEVEKHIAKLRFTPAIQGNKPIPFWLVVPFKFHLK